MFLYRRQGPKKRPKSGTPRKGRNPQKGLPNSARDLLPIIQPATKALAQMLAGRSAASGQLGHARAVLAQTERLVAERAHNRLNPAEREEFFEQVARLKLTLSDADSEAEFQAAEEQAPPQIPVPVDRERLKAMALSLTTSTPSPESPSVDNAHSEDDLESDSRSNGAQPFRNEGSASDLADASQTTVQLSASVQDGTSAEQDGAPEEAKIEDRSNDAGQLRLPRGVADKIEGQVVGLDQRAPRRKPKLSASPKNKTSARTSAKRDTSTAEADKTAGGIETSGTTTAKGRQKLPKGWIIDDEGFVVPGPR